MLNKRHCSPAKGLKGGRHCALSPVLIVVVDDDDDDDDDEKKTGNKEVEKHEGQGGGVRNVERGEAKKRNLVTHTEGKK